MSRWTKRDLLAYLDRVEPALAELDHFELLDLGPEAGDAAIQRAFHLMASRLHPDLYRLEISAEDHERLNIVYGRIAQAYQTLRDPEARDRYLRAAAREVAEATPAEPGDPEAAVKLLSPKAQRLYRRAMAALHTGDATSAMLNLKMALTQHPRSALLEEALAQARAKAKP
jgi:curved DNA-binding protein CbpA